MSRMPALTEERVLVSTELLCNLLFQIQDHAHKEYYGVPPLLGYKECDIEGVIESLENEGMFNNTYFELKDIVEKLDDNSNY